MFVTRRTIFTLVWALLWICATVWFGLELFETSVFHHSRRTAREGREANGSPVTLSMGFLTARSTHLEKLQVRIVSPRLASDALTLRRFRDARAFHVLAVVLSRAATPEIVFAGANIATAALPITTCLAVDAVHVLEPMRHLATRLDRVRSMNDLPYSSTQAALVEDDVSAEFMLLPLQNGEASVVAPRPIAERFAADLKQAEDPLNTQYTTPQVANIITARHVRSSLFQSKDLRDLVVVIDGSSVGYCRQVRAALQMISRSEASDVVVFIRSTPFGSRFWPEDELRCMIASLEGNVTTASVFVGSETHQLARVSREQYAKTISSACTNRRPSDLCIIVVSSRNIELEMRSMKQLTCRGDGKADGTSWISAALVLVAIMVGVLLARGIVRNWFPGSR